MGASMRLATAAGKSGWRLPRGRQQPCNHVEEDHQRAGQQRRSDEAEADDRHIEAGVVGEPGGDAHYLGVATIDHETSVHCGFLERPHVIGSEIVAETSRSAETKAPANSVAVSR